MAFKDFRSFLQRLEEAGQLVRYTEKVDPERDIRAISRAAADMGDTGPAVLMENVAGYSGLSSVAVNVHGSWANYATMMGLPKNTSVKDLFYAVGDRWPKGPGEVKWVDNAPCQEVVIEDDVNVFEAFPVYRVNEGDAGFYLSKASVVTKDQDDPDNFDVQNVGIYRIQIQDKDILAIQALPFHDMAAHLRHAEAKNQPLPVAICLGVDPWLTVVAATPLPYDESEYRYTGALRGEPFELTKAVGSNLDVPAGAEIVLEGEIIPRIRVPEGPFGEFPGSYSGVRVQVPIKVKRITHRRNPIYESLYIGRSWTEHDTLIGLSTCVPMYEQIKATMPEVKAVNALYQHGLTVVIATDNKFGGYAKSVAMRAATTTHGISYVKNIICVDGDVDPFDLRQVMWALSTRVRADKDVIVIPHTPGMPLDPSSEPPGMGNKLIIDATTPAEPDAVMREVKMVDVHIEGVDEFREILTRMQAEQAR